EAALDGVTLAEMERRYILRILKKMGGHQIKTAEILGIDRRTLYRRLRQYGVDASIAKAGFDIDDLQDEFEEEEVRYPSAASAGDGGARGARGGARGRGGGRWPASRRGRRRRRCCAARAGFRRALETRRVGPRSHMRGAIDELRGARAHARDGREGGRAAPSD